MQSYSPAYEKYVAREREREHGEDQEGSKALAVREVTGNMCYS
jgi:hypothetical protein